MKKWLHRLLPILMLSFLLLGLVRTFCFPEDINYYENRSANKAPRFTLYNFCSSAFQDDMEDALNDQIPFAQRMKSLYNQTDTALLSRMLWSNLERFPGQYIQFKNMMLFHTGGEIFVTYPTVIMENITSRLDDKADFLNTRFANHPELDFYLYFIEKDTDIYFPSGYKPGTYEYFSRLLSLPEERMGRFSVDSFAQYTQLFFRTDHHWNYRGAYEGYCQVMELLGKADHLLTPVGETTLPNPFYGSKTTYILGSSTAFQEGFSAYRFDYPEMKISVNGEDVEDYGNQSQFLSLENPTAAVTYGAYYGSDSGQIIFDTGNQEAENILVLGESFDNAILKLMASHFNQLHSIDLRNFESQNGKPFRLAEYTREHEITKVLLIGNLDWFLMSEFLLED